MEPSEFPEATPAQKLNIAQYFIMSSPMGEVDDVVADVQKLVNDPNVLTHDALTSILRDYNTDQMISALDFSGKPVLITKYGSVGNDNYLDPTTGKIYKFDHHRRIFLEETDKKQSLPPTVEVYRSALHSSLSNYLSESFRPNKCVHAVYANDNGHCSIAIAAKNINLTNYWTGSWRGIYTISVLPSSSSSSSSFSSELKGNIKTHVHYFEDGNVQLHSSTDHVASITIDSTQPDVSAKRIVESINRFESDFQNQLEEMYVNMHRTTFKAMRRLLPVNRQKFTWNAAAHSLAQEVSK